MLEAGSPHHYVEPVSSNFVVCAVCSDSLYSFTERKKKHDVFFWVFLFCFFNASDFWVFYHNFCSPEDVSSLQGNQCWYSICVGQQGGVGKEQKGYKFSLHSNQSVSINSWMRVEELEEFVVRGMVLDFLCVACLLLNKSHPKRLLASMCIEQSCLPVIKTAILFC